VELGAAAWRLIEGRPWAVEGLGAWTDGPPFALLPAFEGSKIVGIGSNYRDHALEMGKPVPTVPKLFLKAPSSVLAHEGAIALPPSTQRVDHEAELGVVIGRTCSRVRVEDALAYVFGYTCVNDVTARDLQREDGAVARAKGFDTFCPVGPAVVTGLDPRALEVGCRVNGVVRQSGSTASMVFQVAELIAFTSSVMTLQPGDLIATGTPAGVGPLSAGDVVEVEVEGIGRLRNHVVDRADRA
jgi:2-keto-4-pentenoate hydratase/2-oxohepta-3-ene-1,7-dioic acid hydratase in catechol pathway